MIHVKVSQKIVRHPRYSSPGNIFTYMSFISMKIDYIVDDKKDDGIVTS